MTEDSGRPSRPFFHRRLPAGLVILLTCLTVCFAVFFALGVWQVNRLAWKEDLIARVDRRIHAAPVEAPGMAEWPTVSAAHDEYRHVRITGQFLHGLAAQVQATTALGSGYWVLTPLRTADGSIVMINRGFIPQQLDAAQIELPEAAVTVTGLLRMSEPSGAFLRKNDSARDRWYSRDVQAIARARGLTRVAPYFIDADAFAESVYDHASGARTRYPVGGLTVVSFPNNHLGYALTWFALALMAAGAGAWVLREERRLLRTRRHD